MSAEVLREAAALMRERAEAATPGPWERSFTHILATDGKFLADCFDEPDCSRADAQHIASWDPVVALAVADLLDRVARQHETLVAAFDTGDNGLSPTAINNATGIDEALDVACAYLGESR